MTTAATAGKKAGTARGGRIPELDGLRVLMIFIVSWYHIWQQSWLEPAFDLAGTHISLDFLVRTGYVWVDGTVLLSAFLLYLPLARKNRAPLADVKSFYLRKAKRILPGYWFILLLFFLGMCLPWGLYNGNVPFMVKDLFTHFTLIFPYFRDTYIYTPLGAASWTLSLVAQAYLLFPLIAKGMHRRPGWTMGLLVGSSFAFRAWCLWGLSDYSMVVNTLANFLDVYAVGFGGAILYARMEKKAAEREGGGKLRIVRPLAATLVFAGCLICVCELLKVQCRYTDHAALQAHQQIFRPAFAAGFLGMILSAPFSVRPLRFLLGNRVTAFLGAVSMNYYLTHQTIAVHMKRIGFPSSVSETPNMVREQPWQTNYTLLAFGISLAAAVLITYLVEKPAGRLIDRWAAKKNGASQ